MERTTETGAQKAKGFFLAAFGVYFAIGLTQFCLFVGISPVLESLTYFTVRPLCGPWISGFGLLVWILMLVGFCHLKKTTGLAVIGMLAAISLMVCSGVHFLWYLETCLQMFEMQPFVADLFGMTAEEFYQILPVRLLMGLGSALLAAFFISALFAKRLSGIAAALGLAPAGVLMLQGFFMREQWEFLADVAERLGLISGFIYTPENFSTLRVFVFGIDFLLMFGVLMALLHIDRRPAVVGRVTRSRYWLATVLTASLTTLIGVAFIAQGNVARWLRSTISGSEYMPHGVCLLNLLSLVWAGLFLHMALLPTKARRARDAGVGSYLAFPIVVVEMFGALLPFWVVGEWLELSTAVLWVLFVVLPAVVADIALFGCLPSRPEKGRPEEPNDQPIAPRPRQGMEVAERPRTAYRVAVPVRTVKPEA